MLQLRINMDGERGWRTQLDEGHGHNAQYEHNVQKDVGDMDIAK